ncbi:PKD repeat-containing protein [Singulisphaera sp. GP187]|nr:PKD repeat-containing protein [Singulisphaera sp. GP187]
MTCRHKSADRFWDGLIFRLVNHSRPSREGVGTSADRLRDRRRRARHRELLEAENLERRDIAGSLLTGLGSIAGNGLAAEMRTPFGEGRRSSHQGFSGRGGILPFSIVPRRHDSLPLHQGHGHGLAGGFRLSRGDLHSVQHVSPTSAHPLLPKSLAAGTQHSANTPSGQGAPRKQGSAAPQGGAAARGGGGGVAGSAFGTATRGGTAAQTPTPFSNSGGSSSQVVGASGISGPARLAQSPAPATASRSTPTRAATPSPTPTPGPTSPAPTSIPAQSPQRSSTSTSTLTQLPHSVISTPSGNSIQITCADVDSLTGWSTPESGGSDPGRGGVVSTGGGLVLTEGNSYVVGLEKTLTIPSNPSTLVFQYDNLSFDRTDTHSIKDAFEVALVDGQDKPLVPTIGEARNAFLNVTEGLPTKLGVGTTETGTAVVTVTTDISGLAPQSTAHLIFRLVNNDSDHNTTVRLPCPTSADHPPSVAVDLFDDTAPTGPGSNAYRTDRLTTDPTVAGTASDQDGSVATLEASVDGGAYQDISSTLAAGTFRWTPTGLSAGTHRITIRATDNAGLRAVASTSFTLDAPPVANAGGNQTVAEGDTVTFNASQSTATLAPLFSYQWTFAGGTTSTEPITTRTYADEGSDTATLTVTDTAGATATAAAQVTIGNATPFVRPVADQQVTEGTPYALAVSFADPGTGDKHTATIDWGDGTYSSNATVQEQNGAGTVVATHSYSNEGTHTVTVTVADDDDPAGTASTTFHVTVNPLAPTVTINGPPVTDEGATYTLNLSAIEPSVDTVYDWTIDWGDGTAPETFYGNPPTVTHVYNNDGVTDTITASATDEDGTWNANSLAVTVSNVSPTLVIGGLGSVNAGATYTLNLASTDPGQDDTIDHWTIHWGDGTAPQTISGNPNSATHVYASGPNDDTISATATDQDGTWDSNTVRVHVNAAAPQVAIAGPGVTSEGATYTLNLSATGPGGNSITSWTIAWGDGSAPQILSGNPSTVTHIYADGVTPAVSDTITATATNANGSYPTNTVNVQVLNVAPTVTTVTNPTKTPTYEGSALASNAIVATFTDPGLSDTHTAAVYWGDGTSSAATITESNGSGTVTAGGHTYADNGTYTVKVVVTDKDHGSGSLSTSAMIQNVSPKVSAGFSFVPDPNTGAPIAVVSGEFTDAGFTFAPAGTVETFTETINWGDGTTQTMTPTVVQGSAGVATVGTYSGSHAYAQPGVYQVTVTVTDDDGGRGTATLNFGSSCLPFQVVSAINVGRPGEIPVKIWSCTDAGGNPDFNVNNIVASSLRFGPGGAQADDYNIVPAQAAGWTSSFRASPAGSTRPIKSLTYRAGWRSRETRARSTS